MPSWKVHMIIGAVFVVSTLTILQYLNLLSEYDLWKIMFLPLVLLYSILPDIDSESSIIARVINSFLWIIILCLIILFVIFKNNFLLWGAVCAFAIILFIYTLRHRGFTHSIFAGILVSLPLIFIDKMVAGLAFVSFLSHLIADGEFKIF